jgi:hypothetical protein
MFNTVIIQDPVLFSSNNFAVGGKLQAALLGENLAYIRGGKQFPLNAPGKGDGS